MNEQTPSDDFRPLRDADPAMSAHASDALRARVDGIPASGQAHARRRWLVPVAAAAAVVAVVGGAFAWGSGALAPSPGVTPLAVSTGSPETPAPPIALGPAGGTLGGELHQYAVLPTLGGYEPVRGAHRFIIPPLDTAASTASAWAFEGASRFSAEEASRIAASLGVNGEVREAEIGGWIVGDQASAHILLNTWAVSYSGGALDPIEICEQQGDALYGREKLTEDGSWAFGQHMIRCMDEMPRPSDGDVRAAMVRFLTAIGIDSDQTQITVIDQDDDARIGYGTAALVIDGSVTDITANIAITAQGIMNASGPVGAVVTLGDYPIVSPADAALRLSDTAWAASNLIGSISLTMDSGSGLPPSTPPPAPTPGAAIPWSIGVHEITSARLGLASSFGPDRAHYLVPAYEFTASDSTVWSVIALADEALAESPLG